MTAIAEQEIRQRAALARNRSLLEIRPVNAQKVAEAHDIKVRFATFSNERPQRISNHVAAFYDHEEQAIFVNSAMTGYEMNWYIAVELGKVLIHPFWAASDDYELSSRNDAPESATALDAMIFARALLVIPDLLAPVLKRRTYAEIAQLCVIPLEELRKELPLIAAAQGNQT